MLLTEETEGLNDTLQQILGELITTEISRDEAIAKVKDLINRELQKQGAGICSLCYNRGYSIETKRKTRHFTLCDCGRGFQLRHWIGEFYISRDDLVRIANKRKDEYK